MDKGVEAKDVLRFQIKRICTNMFKSYLIMLEDLAVDHDTALKKLHDALPQEYRVYIDLADYFTQTKSDSLRAKTLDIGNNGIRELDSHLENYDITIKR